VAANRTESHGLIRLRQADLRNAIIYSPELLDKGCGSIFHQNISIPFCCRDFHVLKAPCDPVHHVVRDHTALRPRPAPDKDHPAKLAACATQQQAVSEWLKGGT
jgi:hypothetical protein